jgi:hypothetical protein
MKKIKRYSDYILEKYSADWSRKNDETYNFQIEDNKYFVKFSDTVGKVSVNFGVETPTEHWSFDDLGKSNAFKTMSTVSEIVKDFITKNQSVSKITFFGVSSIRDKSNIPTWFFKLLLSTSFTYLLADYINGILVRPIQWFSKPTQRTKMFGRWAEKEVKDLDWKVSRIGNEIQITKSK